MQCDRTLTDLLLVFWIRIQQGPLMILLFLLFFQRLTNGPQGTYALTAICSLTDGISQVARTGSGTSNKYSQGFHMLDY
jgi:hypothetical protein